MSVLPANTLSVVITVVFLLVILTSALICGLMRRRVKLVPALILFVVAPVSALISAMTCHRLVTSFGHSAFGFAAPMLGQNLRGWVGLMPTAEAGIEAMSGLFAAFLLFVPVFIILYFVLRVLVGLLLRLICGPKDVKGHVESFFTGVVNGVVIGIILLIPLCCLIGSTTGAMQSFFSTGAGDTAVVQEKLDADQLEQLKLYGKTVSENSLVRFVNAVGVRPTASIIGRIEVRVTDTAASGSSDQSQLSVPQTGGGCFAVAAPARPSSAVLGRVNTPVLLAVPEARSGGTTVSFDLNDTLQGLTQTFGYVVVAVDQLSGITETRVLTDAQKTAVDNALAAMTSSDWLMNSATELIHAVASAWSQGNAILNLEYPAFNEIIAPFINTALEVLSTGTVEDIKADLNTVKEIAYLLSDSDLLLGEMSYTTVMNLVWGDGLNRGITDILAQNEHLSIMNTALKDLGFRVLANTIDRQGLDLGQYEELLNRIASALTDLLHMSPSERETAVREVVQSAFELYDVVVPDDLALSLAEEIIDACGDDNVVTRDEVYDFLISHYGQALDYLPDGITDNIPDLPADIPGM